MHTSVTGFSLCEVQFLQSLSSISIWIAQFTSLNMMVTVFAKYDTPIIVFPECIFSEVSHSCACVADVDGEEEEDNYYVEAADDDRCGVSYSKPLLHLG